MKGWAGPGAIITIMLMASSRKALNLIQGNPTMHEEIRILIADDHPIFRKGLRGVIEADPLLKVVADAGDGESALARIRELQPDVAVLDVNMPDPDGLVIARELQDQRLPVGVIFLTMYRDEALFEAALDAGVKGFIIKDSAVNEIVDCIKAVAAGQSFFCATLGDYLAGRNKRAKSTSIDNLTAAERRILLLVAESKSNKEIAVMMSISVRTVERHRSNICAKLGLTGNNALLTFALTHKSDF
jgi:DNA-binding NarL/FixJ family response regulator